MPNKILSLEITGIEPVTFSMRNRRSTTELYPPWHAIEQRIVYIIVLIVVAALLGKYFLSHIKQGHDVKLSYQPNDNKHRPTTSLDYHNATIISRIHTFMYFMYGYCIGFKYARCSEFEKGITEPVKLNHHLM